MSPEIAEVPYSLSPVMVCVPGALGHVPLSAYCTRMLLCGHGWRWLLWPPGSGRDTALSLQACRKQPLLPDPIPGQAPKLQDPTHNACGQVEEVGVGVFLKSPLISAFFFPKSLIALAYAGVPEKQLLQRGTISEYPCKIAELWATK